MYGLRASEVDDDVESQRPSKDRIMMSSYAAREEARENQECQCKLGAWGVRSLLGQREM